MAMLKSDKSILKAEYFLLESHYVRIEIVGIEMKTAIVAITKNGVELGQRLAESLPSSSLYLPAKFVSAPKAGVHPFQKPLREVIEKIFGNYRSLVLVMAVGIAVRLVAPSLRNKREDPGVVVVDEKGKFVVSLLSGHLGGANELAKKIAFLIGAQPVITTASEVNETIPVDILGREFGWELEGESNITSVASAIVNGDPVGIYQDAGERDWWTREKPLPANIHLFTDLEDLKKSDCSAALIITDRLLEKFQALPVVLYRPKSLVVGIGCNRGVACSQIESAVSQVLLESGLSVKSIRNVATVDLKRDEDGLLKFAQKHNLPINFFSKEALCQMKFPSHPSSMASKWIGIPAVCEPAALLSSGSENLVVPKVKLKDVTVAVARRQR